MKDYDIVLASGSEHLRERFEELGYRVYSSALNYDYRRFFPNADIYVRIEKIEELSDRRVIVIQSCTGSSPSESEFYTTSDRVIELLLLLSVLKRPVKTVPTGHKKYKSEPIVPAARVEVVLTFQPFALQDKAFLTGEAVSARWATESIANECNKVWVMNPHPSPSLPWVRNLREKEIYEEIDVIPDLIEFCAFSFKLDDYTVVTPDEGGQERFQVDGFGKSRDNSYHVHLQGKLDVKNQNVVLVDDLTKSGSTLLEAADRLKSQGAADVAMAVAHVIPLMKRGEDLLKRLLDLSKDRIVTTNTIYTETFCEDYPHLCYNIVDTLVKIL
jgi:phosphoribosylpyrophosphate synthetase